MKNDPSEQNLKAFRNMMELYEHQGGPGIELTAIYTLAAIHPAIGARYFCVPCVSCNRPAPFIEDYVGGRSRKVFIGGGGGVRVRCAHCTNWTTGSVKDITSEVWSLPTT